MRKENQRIQENKLELKRICIRTAGLRRRYPIHIITASKSKCICRARREHDGRSWGRHCAGCCEGKITGESGTCWIGIFHPTGGIPTCLQI
jgi:hypothetical protein